MHGLILILSTTSWKCSGQFTAGSEASSKISHLFVVNAAVLVEIITQMVHGRLKGSERDLVHDTDRLLFLGGEFVERPLEET